MANITTNAKATPVPIRRRRRIRLTDADRAVMPPLPKDSRPPVKQLADAIAARNHFACDAAGRLCRFSAGVFKADGDAFVKRSVKQILEAWERTTLWSSRRAEEVVEYLRVDAPALWDRPPVDEVNVLNGLLHLDTGVLRPHSSDFLSLVQIPVAFDPAATCPFWDQFVSEVFPEDAQSLANEIPGELMAPNYSNQTAILFLGVGSNGKSTYLQAVRAFLGRANVSGLSLQKLESDRFAAARLIGKLANICPDLPSAHLEGTSVFKQITGGDTVTAEYKFKDSFDYEPFARLIFSANEPPRSTDDGYAFFRRWRVVPFSRVFVPGVQIPRAELDARLSSKAELSGVLNKALRARREILARGGFTESPSMRAAWSEFRRSTDPFAVWLDEATVECPEGFVVKQVLRDAFNTDAQAAGRLSMTSNAFGRRFHEHRPYIVEAQRVIDGKVERIYVGIGFRRGSRHSPDSPDSSVYTQLDGK